MRSRAILWVSVVMALCIAWVAYRLAWQASRGGDTAPLYSSHRYDPFGTAALRELLEERGVAVTILDHSRLTSAHKGVLIQVLPFETLSLAEIPCEIELPNFVKRSHQIQSDSLRDWVSAGNTVVQFSYGQTGLMGSIGIKPATDIRTIDLAPTIEEQQREGRFPKDLVGAVWQIPWRIPAAAREDGAESIHGTCTMRFPRSFESDGTHALHPIARNRDMTVAGECSFGDGRMVFVGAPTPVLNGNISERDNLEFLLALIGENPVIIDEWSHGIGHDGTVMGLIREYHLTPLLFQTAFVLALYLWSVHGYRHSDTSARPRTPSSTEQIRTLGHIYDKCLSSKQKFERVRLEAMRRVAAAAGVTMTDLQSDRLRMKPAKATAVREVVDQIRALEKHKRKDRDHALARMLTLSNTFARENAHDRRLA